MQICLFDIKCHKNDKSQIFAKELVLCTFHDQVFLGRFHVFIHQKYLIRCDKTSFFNYLITRHDNHDFENRGKNVKEVAK